MPLGDTTDDNVADKRAAKSVLAKEKDAEEVPEKKKKRKLFGAQPAFQWDSIMNVRISFLISASEQAVQSFMPLTTVRLPRERDICCCKSDDLMSVGGWSDPRISVACEAVGKDGRDDSAHWIPVCSVFPSTFAIPIGLNPHLMVFVALSSGPGDSPDLVLNLPGKWLLLHAWVATILVSLCYNAIAI